ncbi:MAG: hypothetical protein LBL42_05205 [Tannerella sp.]|nr:hypothetical protein [Tannerella sp.]
MNEKETVRIEEKGAENMKEIFSISATVKPFSPEGESGFRRGSVKYPEETVSASVETEPESVKMPSGSGEKEKINRFMDFTGKEMENVSLMIFSSIHTGTGNYYIITD